MTAGDGQTKQPVHARVAVYIHTDRLIDNLRAIRTKLPLKTKLVAVIKANAYGHGALALARALEAEEYIWGYALATAEEAISLRDAGIRKPLLILGYTWEGDYEALISRDIRMSIFREDTPEELAAAAARLGKDALVHVAVDTGMSRIGVQPGDAGAAYVARADKLAGITIEGIFTHFARADERDLTAADGQAARFTDFVDRLRAEGIHIPLVHCDNSAGMLALKHRPMDLARAGITMYGLLPSAETDLGGMRLQPVMEMKSHVVCIRTIETGTPVSYGGTWVAARPSRIATIPVGYADGYPRSLSNKGEVLIRGRRASIVGRVCMDQMMVDVTDLPVSQDDEVTLLGRDGGEVITAEELGEKSGRFNYELVCDISERVPRIVCGASHGDSDVNGEDPSRGGSGRE